MPSGGIISNCSLQASYQQASGNAQREKITVSQFSLAANDSQLSVNAAATLGCRQDYTLDIKAAQLNLDALLVSILVTQTQNAMSAMIKKSTPVVSSELGRHEDDALWHLWQSLSAQLALQHAITVA
ncbi:MAG: hypothetical protein ACSLEM_04885 [Candidatus Malihini olakiniferum]